MNFDASVIEIQQKYRLLNGGVDNLAPYSFFTVASCNPPVLLYNQVTQRNGIDKGTLQNLKETGACVVNIVTAKNECNQC